MSGGTDSSAQPMAGPSGLSVGGASNLGGQTSFNPTSMATGAQQQLATYPTSSNADALSAIHMPFDFSGGDMLSNPAHQTNSAPMGESSKQAKPRKRKNADGAEELTAGPGSRGGKGSRGGGGRGGRGGGAGAGAGRKTAKTQQTQQGQDTGAGAGDMMTPGSFVATGDSTSTSRAGSLAPSTPAAGTAPSTPTKRGGRGGRGSRGGGGRGSRGGGRGSRGGRTGSRQASVRRTATASVAPGREDSATAAPDGLAGDDSMIVDGGVAIEADDVDDGVGQEESSEEEEENAAGLEEDEMARQEQIQRDRAMRMEPLMKAMTEEQMERYSAFRRSYLDKRFVRRLVTHMTRQTVTPQVTTLVAGVGKVFIGEIVERARQVRSERAPNDTRPLQPEHLIEALRRYRQDREVPGRYANSAPNFNAGLGGNGERRHLF